MQHYFYQNLLTLATHSQGSGMTHVCSCVTECYRSLCKRWPFGLQKVAFQRAICGLLQRKRRSFGKQPRAGTYQTGLMAGFGMSETWCHEDIFCIGKSMPHRDGEHEAIRQQDHKKRHSGCLSIQKAVKTLHNSHIVQAWDKNFFAKQKKRVSVVRDIRKPCVIHRLTHGNAALRSRIFMPNRYHAYRIRPLSQQPRSKAGGI